MRSLYIVFAKCLATRLLRIVCPTISLWTLLLFMGSPVMARTLPLRLPVAQTGVYQVSYEDMGLTGSLASTSLQLSIQERPVAIIVEDGGDGDFGPGDTIRFYGQAVPRDNRLYRYTGTAMYHLKHLAQGHGLRMLPWMATMATALPVSRFRNTVHAEENRFYWQGMPQGQTKDHWLWSHQLRPGNTARFPVDLPGLLSSGTNAHIRLHLHGKTSGVHRTSLMLNGSHEQVRSWPVTGLGDTPMTLEFDIPVTALHTGRNTVNIAALEDQEGIYVDWIEVDYDRELTGLGDTLAFHLTGTGLQQVNLQGFTAPQAVELFDLSDADHPRLRNRHGSQPVIDLDQTAGPFLAVGAGAWMHLVPQPLHPDSLHSRANRADYIIITHERLKAAIAPLRTHREGQGLTTRVVTMAEIYEAFSAGFVDPDAIKNFLRYAYNNWQRPRPEYVLLLGDASYDYRDYFDNKGASNLVPAHLIEAPGFGEVPSDNWFVAVAGQDNVPDMSIGRIPAKTPAEVTMVVDKILSYERGMPGDWPSRIIVASGDNNGLHGQQRFIDGTNQWLDQIPASSHYSVVSIAPSAVPVNQYVSLRGEFAQALNASGAGFISYFGHGSIDAWLASDTSGVFNGNALELLTSKDAHALKNTRAFPFVAAFNCLNGLFSLPKRIRPINGNGGKQTFEKSIQPLAEALLFQPNKGAVAMLAATSLAYASEQTAMGEALYQALFDDTQTQKVLGKIVTQSKIQAVKTQGADPQNLDIITLIGDPATHLAIRGRTASGSVSGALPPAGGGGGGLSWPALAMLFLLRYRKGT